MSNPYISDFLNLANERFSIDSLSMSTADWVRKNTTLRNRPFNFKGYEFQEQITNDWHPNLDVIKISQVGLTELMLRKALAFLVRNNGSSLIMTEPTEDMMKRVSSSRVKPIINKDKVFNTHQDKENKATRSMDMMQFGQSFLYLVAAIEASATSIPADVVFNDEVDLSDQQMLALFNSRLQNSSHKISQRFSTPSFPSYGIDLNWQASDQHYYMCKCNSCGHWQHPEFNRDFIVIPGLSEDIQDLSQITRDMEDGIHLEQSYVKCEKCDKPLDLTDHDNRQWVSKYPHRVNSRGYRVGPFSTGRLDIPYIVKSLWDYQKNEYVRGFHNTVLGMPYSDGSMQIPEADILACMTNQTSMPEVSAFDDMWVGIDMGQTCHIVLGKGTSPENLQIVRMYHVHVSEIVQHCVNLVKDYNIRGGAIDRHPYEPTSREIFKATNGIIVPVEYRGMKDINTVYNDYDEMTHAQVNHTWFLDNFASKVRKHTMKISGYGVQKRAIIEHYRDMVREEVPGEPAKWKKLNGNDHYLHASAFMAVAMNIKDLVLHERKDDVRTMALGSIARIPNASDNIIGVSKKRSDRTPNGGLL